MSATLTLRPYQDEGLARVEAAQARGVRSLLGVAATGLGKTIMFVQLIRRRGGRAVVLVHRDELVNQAVIKLCEADPTRPVTASVHSVLVNAERFDLLEDRVVSYSVDSIGIVKAAADDVGSQWIVASVQTLGRPARLHRLIDWAGVHTVIVDEAHHSKADTYLRVLSALHAGEVDGPMLFGCTATPERGDGQGLADVYEEVAFNYDILWGIRAGYLSDLRARRIVLQGFNEKALKVSRGDFTEASSGQALEDADAPRHIVAGWLAEAMGRKTLAFLPTVKLAEATCEAFKSAGVRAGWVCGATPMDERRDLLARFHDGDIQVMVNCMVLTEGYDEPSIECIVVARPTKQQGLYVQMVGHGTRRYPGKDDCILEGQRVLTNHGLVPIEQVTTAMKVWDGEQYVTHYGAVCRGVQEVITYAGLTATPDHKVWTSTGWQRFGDCARRGTPISVTGAGGTALALSALQRSEAAMHEPAEQGVGEVWGTGHRVPIRVGDRDGCVGGREPWPAPGDAARPDRQQPPLRAGELAVLDRRAEPGAHPEASAEPAGACVPAGAPRGAVLGQHDVEAGRHPDRRADHRAVEHSVVQAQGRVWDLLNAGPLHRFTVEGLLVSNCLVLDVVGVTDRHSLVTVPSLFGLEDDVAVVQGDKLLSQGVRDNEQELIRQGRLAARDAELFKAVSASSIAWVDTTDPKTGLSAYMRSLGAVKRGNEVTYLPTVRLIRRDAEADSWVCGLQFDDGSKRVLIDHVPLTTAMAVGEDFVRKSPNQRIVNKDAGWRKGPVTAKQRAMCDKWRIKVPDGATAGDVSELIDKKIAAWKAKKAAKL